MNFNNTTSISYRVAECIYLKGPMPSANVVESIDENPKMVQRTIGRMCFEGDLESYGGNLQLTSGLRRHFADKHKDTTAIAESRTGSNFKPWSGKYSLANALLREPIRTDFHVLNASSEFRPLGGA